MELEGGDQGEGKKANARVMSDTCLEVDSFPLAALASHWFFVPTSSVAATWTVRHCNARDGVKRSRGWHRASFAPPRKRKDVAAPSGSSGRSDVARLGSVHCMPKRGAAQYRLCRDGT